MSVAMWVSLVPSAILLRPPLPLLSAQEHLLAVQNGQHSPDDQYSTYDTCERDDSVLNCPPRLLKEWWICLELAVVAFVWMLSLIANPCGFRLIGGFCSAQTFTRLPVVFESNLFTVNVDTTLIEGF